MAVETTATVLVAEDDAQVAELFARSLADRYDVRTATVGNEAIMELDEGVDVVLLDRRMPDISGEEILETIEIRGLDCHVAIVTAVEPDFDVIDMGFDDYLTKPVSPAEIRETVERLLTLSEYEQKYQELSGKRVKKNILEVEKSARELQANERFQELDARIGELESELSQMETEEEFDQRLLPT